MRLQTVLLIVVLVGVAVFLLRQARHSASSGHRKRFDSALPQQNAPHLYGPVFTGSAFDGAGHGQGTDCGAGPVDAGGGCSDGGGGGGSN
jgi:hypothetical protein